MLHAQETLGNCSYISQIRYSSCDFMCNVHNWAGIIELSAGMWFSLDIGRISDKYMRVEYEDEECKTRPHPATLPCLIILLVFVLNSYFNSFFNIQFRLTPIFNRGESKHKHTVHFVFNLFGWHKLSPNPNGQFDLFIFWFESYDA